MTETVPSERDASAGTATASLSPAQVRKGLVLLGGFVVLRAGVAWAWNEFFGGAYHVTLTFLAFFFGVFLVLSVGLVYLGFTRWVGVDLRTWWLPEQGVWREIGWGIGGAIVLVVVLAVGSIALLNAGLGPAAPPDAPTGETTELLSPGQYALGLFFGFAIAAFQEETLFRGFLQDALAVRIGAAPAVAVQALAFSLAHLGYYPVSAWPLYVLAFLVGLVLGVLKRRRGTLLAAGLAHGLVG